jgi:Fur family peroxide stress response transcriptional regulator
MVIPKQEVRRRVEQLVDACRAEGLKVTHQRTEVFRELARTEEHPDADTIWERVRRRVPAISRDTVYRTLTLLEQQGLIRKVDPLHDRARFDANMDSHHHFVCTECGMVRDFHSDELDAFEPPEEVSGWGEVRFVQVQLRGVCARCRARKERQS